MKVSIKYRLDGVGQKKSIIAGGDGATIQELEVARDDPHFAEVVEHSKVNHNGSEAMIDMSCVDYTNAWPEFDHVPTLDELLAAYHERNRKMQERKDKEAAEDATALAAYVALPLAERVARDGGQGVWKLVPLNLHRCRPLSRTAEYDVLIAVPAYAEAVAELERLRKIDRLEAQRKSEEKAAAVKAERERLGLTDGDVYLPIEDGALTNVPAGCWESHKRGKNWLATIAADPTAPGGLARRFWDRAKGDSFYIVAGEVAAGDAVEFGADYYSGGGRPSRKRWYGHVVRVSGEAMVVHEASTAKAAIAAGVKHAKACGKKSPADAIDEGMARVNSEGAIVPNE